MGWISHVLLGDFGQSIDINDAQERIQRQEAAQRRQQGSQRDQQSQIEQLKAHNERLHLALTALSRFLIEKHIIGEAELRAFIEQVDREDGAADGRMPIQ